MSIRIVTDSTCDLPEEVVTEHGITVIPVYINIGGKSYLDNVEISRREFYERLPDYDPPPTTSAPGLGTFVEAYEQLAAGGATEDDLLDHLLGPREEDSFESLRTATGGASRDWRGRPRGAPHPPTAHPARP